jgi:hypothetical protein
MHPARTFVWMLMSLAGIKYLATLLNVSAVELAIKEVKKLSPSQAQELLNWLGTHPLNGTHTPPAKRTSRRKRTNQPSMKRIKAWYDSVRFTTDWEPPRMPDDLVKRVSV